MIPALPQHRLLGAALLFVSFAACQSAAPRGASAPAAPEAPQTASNPAPVPSVPPTPIAPLPPPPEAPPPVAIVDNGDDPAEREEAAGNGAEETQKEALDLCQSATELLARGEREAAIAAIDRAYSLMIELPNGKDDTWLQAKDDIRVLVADLIRQSHRGAARSGSASWDSALQVVDNDHVRREIASFTTVEREFFVDAYRRSGLYRPMILAKLEASALPSQLSWLPMVESWFKVRALSRAGAFGMWQFISSTGLRYGLNRDGWIDERLDPEKSTDAAIAYLSELHTLFGDWPKALAAYNCGEGRVLRLQRSPDHYLDFWDLYELLPRETRRYVPRLLAAILIIENPQRYGMVLPEPQRPHEDVATVRIERSISLDKLAETAGLASETLRELNPELRYGSTPNRAYDLRTPSAVAATLPALAAALPEWKQPRPEYHVHRVRSGETLGTIARRYGTSIGAIQRANGLRSANRLSVGQRLRIPSPGTKG